MPLRNGRLTVAEKAIAHAIAETGSRPYAGFVAGMTGDGVRHVLQRDGVKAEIVREQTRRLHDTLLPLAVGRLESILRDNTVRPADHNQAVKIVLTYTLGRDQDGSDKQPHEMSAHELDRALADAKLRAAALASVQADRARPVIEGEQLEALEALEVDLFA